MFKNNAVPCRTTISAPDRHSPLFGIALYPAKQTQGECNEAHGQDIMVHGACPTKSVFPSASMLEDTTYPAGGA
jgi:hypothetical protein